MVPRRWLQRFGAAGAKGPIQDRYPAPSRHLLHRCPRLGGTVYMHKILLALTGAALSAAAVSFPVYADHASGSRTADTDTTFTITRGDLTITAPSSADLGSGSISDGSFSGQLGNVTVTDDRG